MKRFCLALLLLALSLAPRVYNIAAHTPEPDELLWRERSWTIVDNLKHDRFAVATAHLKHPGVPPALVMASGQAVANSLNLRRGSKLGDGQYIDRLTAARISNALVSGICPSLLFLGTAALVGEGIAFFAALLLAFDPHAIAASRMAHLDAILMCLVALTILLYWAAVERSSLKLKLLSGVTWGLAVCTKPTAVVLLGYFVVHKLIRNLIIPAEGDQGERRIITWGDWWAFLIGNAVLMGTAQRLWLTKIEALGRLRQNGLLLNLVSGTASFLGEHFALSLAFLLTTTLLGAFLIWNWQREEGPTLKFNAAMIAFSASFLLALFTVVPQVVVNSARFWLYAKSLTHEIPEPHGLWHPPTWGYLELFFRKLPVSSILLLALSVPCAVVLILKRFPEFNRRRLLFWASSLAVVLIWVAAISLPEKKVYRYAIPVLPELMLVAAVAPMTFFLHYLQKLRPGLRVSAAGGLMLVAAAYYGAIFEELGHNHRLYVNDLSGGLRGLRDAGLKIHPADHEEVFSYLVEAHQRENKPLTVGVIGDSVEVVSEAFALKYPHLRQAIRFVRSTSPYQTDYVFIVGGYEQLEQELREAFKADSKLRPEYVVRVDNLEIFELYRSPLVPLPGQEQLALKRLHHATGAIHKISQPKPGIAIGVDSTKDKAGYVAFSNGYRVAPGPYTLRLDVQLTRPVKSATDEALRLEFAGCKRRVTAAELNQNGPTEIALPCRLENRHWTKFNAYWPGAVGLDITSAAIVPEVEKAKS